MKKFKKEYEDHFIKDHKGVQTLTCHTCVRIGGLMRGYRILLEEAGKNV